MAEAQALEPVGDLDAVRRAVDARVRAAGTSFFWAMRFLPAAKRDAIFAVYAFCREVDDIADGDLPRDMKVGALAAWRAEIERLYEGTPARDVTRALKGPVQSFALEKEAFL